MGKFLDQKFYIDFTLLATKSDASPFSDDTPVRVRLPSTRYQSVFGGAASYLRTANIENALSGGAYTYDSWVDSAGYYVWGTSDCEQPVFSGASAGMLNTSFTLEFGNLNLPLTDEVIELIDDTDKPKFTRTIDVEKEDGDVAFIKLFNRFMTGRKFIRRSYYSSGTLMKEKTSRLLTTDSELRLPIPLILTVERAAAGSVSVTFTYKPARTVLEINSTGEESTLWS
ncbi:MAG: hypothetical protein IKE64_06755 [Thermoguttaceae bacterium]|nr:hypothetical protein [Thermoguttaceae bacterium]